MSDTYERYPVTMAHPHFVPAKSTPIPGTERRDSRGQIVHQDYQGTPQHLPPVTARSEAEEAYYRSQGYELAGQVDPSAWVRAHADAPPAEYKPQKYPMWGKDARGNPVLYKTAQDDPDATEEDLAPPVVAAEPATAPEPASLNQADNALAAERELRAVQDARIAQMQAEIERLSALKDKRSAPRRNRSAKAA